MSDQLLIAIVGAAAGIAGGIIGAIASPVGKDWVGRRKSEREIVREQAERERDQAGKAAEARLGAIRRTLDDLARSMEHYDLAWRGLAVKRDGKPEVVRAANAAWVHAREIDDNASRELVNVWKSVIDAADMQYREGRPPPGLAETQKAYSDVAAALGHILLAASR